MSRETRKLKGKAYLSRRWGDGYRQIPTTGASESDFRPVYGSSRSLRHSPNPRGQHIQRIHIRRKHPGRLRQKTRSPPVRHEKEEHERWPNNRSYPSIEADRGNTETAQRCLGLAGSVRQETGRLGIVVEFDSSDPRSALLLPYLVGCLINKVINGESEYHA